MGDARRFRIVDNGRHSARKVNELIRTPIVLEIDRRADRIGVKGNNRDVIDIEGPVIRIPRSIADDSRIENKAYTGIDADRTREIERQLFPAGAAMASLGLGSSGAFQPDQNVYSTL